MASKAQKEPAGFWEQPQMMTLVADLLLSAAVLALAAAAALGLLRLPFFALREVVVLTPLKQVTAQQLEYAARSGVKGNFFTLDLERVRAAFEKLPWVRKVEAHRVWPGGVALAIEEHQAVALWKPGEGESRLVNAQGEVFTAASNAQLPQFAGPEGSAPEMLSRYQQFSEALAPLERKPLRLVLSARQAWQVKLDDGLTVDLGRDQPRATATDRLRRFVAVYENTMARVQAKPAVADLRYPNGFALRLAGRVPDQKSKR